MTQLDTCIVNYSKAAWEEEFLAGTPNKNNCSGFVKAVAKKLGVVLPDTANADGIVSTLAANRSWTKLKSGADAALEAGKGNLVIAGLKAADHSPARNNGHVAIVVTGTLYKGKYPIVWGGSIGGAQSQGSKSVGEVWNRNDRDNVVYYAYSTQVCNK